MSMNKQPEYVGVVVSQNRRVYAADATATVFHSGSRILVSGGYGSTATLGEVFKITSSEGLLDTHGVLVGDGEYINVQ